jgi:succinoglycan biosynthesis transport protein ExoP
MHDSQDLDRRREAIHPTRSHEMMQSNAGSFDWVPDLAGFMRRRWATILIGMTATMALGMTYVLTATPKFTATSTILIDTQAAASFQQQPTVSDSQFANGIVESQVEVLQSAGVARDVVRKLRLTDDTAFLVNGNSLIGSIVGPIAKLFSADIAETEEGRETAATELLVKLCDVRRTGTSFVLDLAVRTTDPVMSARLANAIVSAYVEAGLNAKSNNTKRASNWMEQRIGQLHDQAITADQAAQSFKASNNIVETDKGLMNERHLGELNSQVVLARAHSAETRGRRDQIQSILSNGLFTGDVSDAMQNVVIIHLREQYVDAARQAAEWETKLGAGHVAVKTARNRMTDIETQIQTELQRIANGYENDYRAAVKSQTDIEAQLSDLVAQADGTNSNLVHLRALQSSADTYRSLYQNFLQRYTQAVQDQSFPISEVEIVTLASPPLRKSHPKGLIILGAAGMLGLGLGFAAAFLREALDSSIRTTAQIRNDLGVASLGLLPAIKPRRTVSLGHTDRGPSSNESRVIWNVPPILCQSIDAPNGAFAETIRGLRVRMTRGRVGSSNVRVIACVSALPGEGKSTTCANFAFSLAQSGFRTLLLDWDFRKQSLSQLLAPERRAGFAAVASGDVALADAVWRHVETKLDFLPADPRAAQVDLGGIQARKQLTTLREAYDYVVIDLPAVSAVADALSAAGAVDGYLLVIEWGRTPLEVVQETLADLNAGSALGAVLNKVDVNALTRYPAGNYYGQSSAASQDTHKTLV